MLVRTSPRRDKLKTARYATIRMPSTLGLMEGYLFSVETPRDGSANYSLSYQPARRSGSLVTWTVRVTVRIAIQEQDLSLLSRY